MSVLPPHEATARGTAALAPCAVGEAASRGRAYDEDAPAYRGAFQRDRDRVIHSAAFRRLEYKTQVFVNHEGDMFRTRLTHSIEVAQISRTIARALGLNEDLVEAIALAHDLGHTPFGHAGQDALNACMRDHGGFEHNLQSLRVVEVLEERYADFPGLNLTYETREGILKHCSRANARRLGPARGTLPRRRPALAGGAGREPRRRDRVQQPRRRRRAAGRAAGRRGPGRGGALPRTVRNGAGALAGSGGTEDRPRDDPGDDQPSGDGPARSEPRRHRGRSPGQPRRRARAPRAPDSFQRRHVRAAPGAQAAPPAPALPPLPGASDVDESATDRQGPVRGLLRRPPAASRTIPSGGSTNRAGARPNAPVSSPTTWPA